MRKILFILLVSVCCLCRSEAQTITFDSIYNLWHTESGMCVENFQRGYLVAGHAGGLNFDSHAYVLQTDSVGRTIKLIDSINGYNASTKWVTRTNDGGFITGDDWAGAVISELHFRKYDASGNFEWVTSMRPTPNNRVRSIIQTADNGYVAICVRTTINSTGWRSWLIKLDANGDSLWARDLNPALAVAEAGTVRELANGNLLSAIIKSNGEQRFIETQPDGTSPVTYDFPEFFPAIGTSFSLRNAGAITVAGGQMIGGEPKLLLRFLDPAKTITSQDTFTPPVTTTLLGVTCMTMDSDSGYIIGSTVYTADAYYRIWLIRTDKNGTLIWDRILVRPTGTWSDEYLADLKFCPADNGIILTGQSVTHSLPFIFDAFLTKLDSLGKFYVPDPFYSEESIIFPNPVQDEFSVGIPNAEAGQQICIVDMRGRLVLQSEISTPGENGYSLTTFRHTLARGVYECYLTGNDERRHLGKLVVMPTN